MLSFPFRLCYLDWSALLFPIFGGNAFNYLKALCSFFWTPLHCTCTFLLFCPPFQAILGILFFLSSTWHQESLQILLLDQLWRNLLRESWGYLKLLRLSLDFNCCHVTSQIKIQKKQVPWCRSILMQANFISPNPLPWISHLPLILLFTSGHCHFSTHQDMSPVSAHYLPISLKKGPYPKHHLSIPLYCCCLINCVPPALFFAQDSCICCAPNIWHYLLVYWVLRMNRWQWKATCALRWLCS